MQLYNNIDENVIYMLNGKKFRLFRHLLSLLIIGVVIFNMIYKNSDGYYSEYGLLYQFIGIYLLFARGNLFQFIFTCP
jgi:hypothetical protein